MTRGMVLRLIAAVLIVALVWWQTDSADALARLRQADPRWLLAGLVVLWAQTALSAWRWRLVGRALGQRLTARRALSEYFLAQLVNQTLPGGVLGDVARAWRSADGAGRARAGAAVLTERLLGQAAMLALLAAGLVWAALGPAASSGAIRVPPAVLLPAGVVLAALAVLLTGLRLSPRIVRAGAALLTARVLLPQLGLSLLAAAANLAAFDFAARATGTALPPAAVPVLVPLILLTMLVPVSVSGWGLREGAAAALFPLVGAAAGAGLAASTAFGLIFLASSLAGAGFFALHGLMTARGGAARPRPQKPETPK